MYWFLPPLQAVYIEVRRKCGESAEKVFSAIAANFNIKTHEISAKTELAQRTVEKAIAALKRAGILKRIGPDKGGRWEVVSEKLEQRNAK